MFSFKYLYFIFFVFAFFVVPKNGIAQTKEMLSRPAICGAVPAGYIYDQYQATVGNELNCLMQGSAPIAFSNSISTSNLLDPIIANRRTALLNASVYIDVTPEVANLAQLNAAIIPKTPNGDKVLYDFPSTSDEIHWIVITGTNAAGKNTITCKLVEIKKLSTPDVKVIKCNIGLGLITLQIPDNANNNIYDRFSFGWTSTAMTQTLDINANPLPQTVSHNYPLGSIADTAYIQGTYVMQKNVAFGIEGKSCFTDNIPIVNDSKDPTYITALNTSNIANVKIDFFDSRVGDNDYEVFAQKVNTAGWISQGISKTGSINLQNKLDSNTQYCFKIVSKSVCGRNVESTNMVCNINLEQNVINSSNATIKWNLPIVPTFINEELYLNGQPEPLGDNSGANADIKREYEDLSCGRKYDFSLVAKYQSINPYDPTKKIDISITSNSQLLVLKKPGLDFTPKKFTEVSYMPRNIGQIRIIMEPTVLDPTINLYRADNGSNSYSLITKLAPGTSTTYIDDVSGNPLNTSYCYKYTEEDACGQLSKESEPFCTFNLSVNPNNNEKFTYTPYLLPTPPSDDYNISSTGGVNGTQYKVYYSINNGQSWTEYQTNSTFSFDFTKADLANLPSSSRYVFRITAIQNFTIDILSPKQNTMFDREIYSNWYIYEVYPSVFTPTVFSPESAIDDNKSFKIVGKLVKSSASNLLVFNRYGEEVFKTEDIFSATNFWKGKDTAGGELPSGAYQYIINAISDYGDQVVKKGTVFLER